MAKKKGWYEWLKTNVIEVILVIAIIAIMITAILGNTLGRK